MAHYARVVDNIVTKIIVADAAFVLRLVENEPGNWVKTSYNMYGGVYYDPNTREPAEDQSIIHNDEARERKNFAGVGFNYDGTGFYSPQPFPSWTLNTENYLWTAPVSYPDDGQDYVWDEEAYQADNTQGWTLVE